MIHSNLFLQSTSELEQIALLVNGWELKNKTNQTKQVIDNSKDDY